MTEDAVEQAVTSRPVHLTSQFPEPESDRIVSFGVEPARDFAPERTQQANVYEAVAAHVGRLREERAQGRARQLHGAVRASAF